MKKSIGSRPPFFSILRSLWIGLRRRSAEQTIPCFYARWEKTRSREHSKVRWRAKQSGIASFAFVTFVLRKICRFAKSFF